MFVLQLLDIVFYQHTADGWTKEGLTFRDEAHRVDEVSLGGFFQQVSARASLKSPQDEGFIRMHAQDNGGNAKLPGGDLACRLDAVQIRHGDVEYSDVGPCQFRQTHRGTAV